ncbi:MAG: hypothetical protein IPH07_03240 [Deltaproteobacteria bacterium]|nr:hypothetical protein [Deltaproteobacteria bacterium]MBP7290111.1 hypothetical protein [Nannocystaceae bacterium]
MRNLFFVTLGVLGLAFSACEKSSQPTTPPPGDTAGAVGGEGATTEAAEGGAAEGGASGDGGGATEPGAPGVAWHDKTHKQRMEFMGLEVLPKMKKSFQAYDASGFGTFKCETCHGKSGKDKGYEMPNDLMGLDKADPIKSGKDYDEKVTKFMVEQVVPEMAAIMGEKVDNVGAYCMECHPAN